MSGNRVEELEAKVRELEATIDGLTDELVETKERLGTIEEETGIEPDALDGWGTRTSDQEDETESAAEADDVDASTEEAPEAETDDDDETADSAGDDIIVA